MAFKGGRLRSGLLDVVLGDARCAGLCPRLGMSDEPARDAEPVLGEEADVLWVCDLPDLTEDQGGQGRVGKEGDGAVTGEDAELVGVCALKEVVVGVSLCG